MQEDNKKEPGKVWLVGAGPGDVGLFTMKGAQVLEQADVVVYDSLVGQGILTRIPASAKLINVGKRAGHHTMSQEKINQVLAEEAKKGNKVVRLKGGDPFLFGRGGEELELLTKEGIPYEIVPGVTSPISVPAYNGIPVTHRDFCSSVHVITGHKRKGMEYDIDFGALVHTKGTLVFLMGITAMEDICNGLMKAGMEPDMPAAVLSKGTTAGQKRVVATVGTLKAAADQAKIQTPAIIVVGKVCTLADDFAWYEKLPLAGWKILVTRPKENISRTAALLREKGAEVLELPSISIIPLEDQSRLYQAFSHIRSYDWLVFTSPAGVEVFFRQMEKKKIDLRSLGNAKIAVIGEGTKKKFLERGIYPDFMPSVYDGNTLGKELGALLNGTEKILIPRASLGNKELAEELKKTGAQVDDVPTYETGYVSCPLINEKREFEEGTIDLAVFTSASTVKGFVESTKGLDYSRVRAACIGKQTRAAADSYGMQTYMSEKATIDSLIELVETLKRSEEKWN
ncbi:MAG: uroporphyrinogen-III C-methyltransferase [Blautia faecis]